MLRAIIIDDEAAGVQSLQLLFEKNIAQVKVVATTTNAKQGIRIIEDYKPEIVFLDISMPGLNGFELLDALEYKDFNLVFITAYQEYAIKAIKHHAFDYLLKPVDTDELKNCVNRIFRAREENKIQPKTQTQNIIGISVKDGIIFVRHAEIIRLEASGSYTIFHLENKVKHMASKSLKEYEAQLDPALFYRCHNSHIVHLSKVVKFSSSEGLFAQMTDGSKADIARKNKDQFLERLKNIGI